MASVLLGSAAELVLVDSAAALDSVLVVSEAELESVLVA